MNLENLKLQQRSLYERIGPVYSPALKERVFFTAEGYRHLLFESNRTQRSVAEQYIKLNNLCFVEEVIKNCPTVTDVRLRKQRVHGVKKEVTYYELVHEVMSGLQIRVIIARAGQGRHIFLSVMTHARGSKPKKRP